MRMINALMSSDTLANVQKKLLFLLLLFVVIMYLKTNVNGLLFIQALDNV